MQIDTSSHPSEQLFAVLNQEISVRQPLMIFLSGGSLVAVITEWVRQFPVTQRLEHVTFALVDERWGNVGHTDSNETAYRVAGVVDRLIAHGAQWISILTGERMEVEVARLDNILREVGDTTRIIGLFGMGEDGHTAGILPICHSFDEWEETFGVQSWYCGYDVDKIAPEYPNPFHQRITMTPWGITQLNCTILFATGEKKQAVLHQLVTHTDHRVWEFPAGVLLPDVTIMTDQ